MCHIFSNLDATNHIEALILGCGASLWSKPCITCQIQSAVYSLYSASMTILRTFLWFQQKKTYASLYHICGDFY